MTPDYIAHGRRGPRWLLALALLLWLVPGASAKIQFDAFPGYDAVARSGGWYPVAFEIFNDGPGFDATIEVSTAQLGGGTVTYPLELPTNTRKRVVLPVFSSSQGFLAVDTRLRDARGRIVAENTGTRLTQLAWESFLMAGAPASFAGMPAFPEGNGRQAAQADLQARCVRLDLGQRLESFPEDPVALEGLNAIYLNSTMALDLKDPQVEALLAWVHLGGHLVVTVNQPTDVTATPWLRDALPATVGGLQNARMNGELHRWLQQSSGPGRGNLQFGLQSPPLPARDNTRPTMDSDAFGSLEPDAAFDRETMPVVELVPRGGTALASAGALPLVVSGARGRGLVTVLAFNPERAPAKAWKHRAWFWAKVAGVPRELLRNTDLNAWGGRSVDSVFGAMIETRQVRKLPVGVLLLLLLAYLVVIGPLDQWWLRRIKRPMLTWVTFPAYVALFSLLIYYIGFRLRSGNTEWNELHVVDVLPRGADAVLRGRAYTSLYSPANQTYRVACGLPSATLRPEFQGLWGNHNEGGRVSVRRKARGIEADLYVPVWTSQLNVGDWIDSGPAPLQARREGTVLTIRNLREAALTNVTVVANGAMYRVGTVAGGGTAQVDFGKASSSPLDWIREWQPRLHAAANQRNEVFGGGSGDHIDDWADAASAMSLTSRAASGAAGGNGRDWVWPAGLDLTPCLERGDAVVLAYLPGESLVPPWNQFEPLRRQSGTLLRLVVPAARPNNP